MLAQMGAFVACEKFTFQPFHHVLCKISSEDNLFKGQSTFVCEMIELRNILRIANSNSLILCDELTAGTETHSATGLVASAITCLLNKNANFIFTTHLHGLPSLIKHDNLKIYHFKVSIKGEKIKYNYTLSKGIGQSIYGIEIAKALGLDRNFIIDALKFRAKFSRYESTEFIQDKKSHFNRKVIMDQCEKCGSALNPQELKNPISTLSLKNPVLKKTEHWYLPMKNHERWLKEWLMKGVFAGEKKHDVKKWRKQVVSQCKSWLDGGLKSRAMTRDLDWGVKVPLPNYENKVLYVWLDAPIGYISATKKYCLENNLNWIDFWKKDNSKIVHFIGKDNIVFHCVIFPIILKCLEDFNLPNNVVANEFLNIEGNKISTSKNWAVWLDDYLQDFSDQQDSLRYTLCITAPESKDNDFTWKEFQARNNNELVAILGNFINRVFVLIHKYWEGKVPCNIIYTNNDKEFLSNLNNIKNKIDLKIREFKFKEALGEIMNIARLGNKFLADNEPWKLIKEDEERTKTILFISVEIIRQICIFIKPFLPFTSNKLQKMLNIENELSWADADKTLKSNHVLNKPILLFRIIEDKEIKNQVQQLKNNRL